MKKHLSILLVLFIFVSFLYSQGNNKFWVNNYLNSEINYNNPNTYQLLKQNYNVNQNKLDVTIRIFDQPDNINKWRENYNNSSIITKNLNEDFKLDEENLYLFTIINNQKYYYIPGEKYPVLFPADKLSNLNVSQNQLINKNDSIMFSIKNIETSSALIENTKNGKYKYDGKNIEWYPLGYYKVGGVYQEFVSQPWVEGSKGDGIGEYIEFDCTSPYLFVLNGFVDIRRPYLYKENNRIKKCKLIITTDKGSEEKEVAFDDYAHIKSISLPKNTKHIKLVITEVYHGDKYNDLAVTSIYTYGTFIDG